MYVRTYVHTDLKKMVDGIVLDMNRSFNNILDDIDWMDGKTKANAKTKLMTMQRYVGYRNQFYNDTELEYLYQVIQIMIMILHYNCLY